MKKQKNKGGWLDKYEDGGSVHKAQNGIKETINKYLEDPYGEAREFAENPDELSNIDNMRHAQATRLTQEAIANKTGNIPLISDTLGFLGSNALGIGHELTTLFGDKDKRDWSTKLQEFGEDSFNNLFGSAIGTLPIADETKDNIIKYASYNNMLPDGYVRGKQGKKDGLSENVYFKNEDNEVRRPEYQMGGSVHKAQNGPDVERYSNLKKQDNTRTTSHRVVRKPEGFRDYNKTDEEYAEERRLVREKASKNVLSQDNWEAFDPDNITRENLAESSAGLESQFRYDDKPNFFDDYINPLNMIGGMASNLGQAPLQAEQSNSFLPYATAIGLPLTVGALSGFGAPSTGQFVNNVVNPLAGFAGNTSKTALRSSVDMVSPVGRKLREIRRAGLKEGLSEKEISKLQMNQVGITSKQREGYFPIASEIVSEYITPYGYNDVMKRIRNVPRRIIKGETNSKKLMEAFDDVPTDPQIMIESALSQPRYDAWRLYSGLPQKNKTFRVADTSPINHPSYTPKELDELEKFSLNAEHNLKNDLPSEFGAHKMGLDIENLKVSARPNDKKKLFAGYLVDESQRQLRKLNLMKSGRIDVISDFNQTNIMGRYNRRYFDNKIEYNDIWDLNLKGTGVGDKFNNVDDYFGKPFLSHGQIDYNLPITELGYHRAVSKGNALRYDMGSNKVRAKLDPSEPLPKQKQGGVIKDNNKFKEGGSVPKAQNGPPGQFLKGELKEQPPEPTWLDDLSDGISDFGTRTLNAITTFGGSAIGDAVNAISPEAAQNLEDYSAGFIPYTHEQDLVQNRSSNPERWNNRIGDTQDALFSAGIDAMTMGLFNKLPGGALAKGIKNDPTIQRTTIGKGHQTIQELLTPINQTRTQSALPKNMEPYLSRKVYPFNKEQEVFQSFLSTDKQLKNINSKSINYDAAGNIIPNFKQGGVIKDDMGQWAHPGEITEISGNTMATHGYGDIPLYVVPDVGEPRMVQANTGTQTFPGATKFTEYPMAKNGSLVELNQLTNFTNYNTPQPGGWLDKYN